MKDRILVLLAFEVYFCFVQDVFGILLFFFVDHQFFVREEGGLGVEGKGHLDFVCLWGQQFALEIREVVKGFNILLVLDQS